MTSPVGDPLTPKTTAFSTQDDHVEEWTTMVTGFLKVFSIEPLGYGSKMLLLRVVIRVDPTTQKHFPLYYTSPQPLIYNININKELIYTKEFL